MHSLILYTSSLMGGALASNFPREEYAVQVRSGQVRSGQGITLFC